MPLRVDIDRERLTAAIQLQINSLKRAKTNAKNPAFVPIIDKDIADLTTAMNTITETK